MKKLFILLITLASVTGVSAQQARKTDSRNDDRNNHSKDIVLNKDRAPQSNDRDYKYDSRDNRNNDKYRQQEIDKINKEYDRRINDFRNDRKLDRYERDRRIAQVEKERQTKLKSFGSGALVGAVAGVILGVLIAGK